MGKRSLDLTPEQRAAEAERAKLLRQFGKKHGLNLIAEKLDAEKLREAETAPAPPQELTRKRKTGGGNKPKMAKDIERGKAAYLSMLDEDPTWAENRTASAVRVIELLKLGNSVSVWTVKRWIVDPVLKEREQNKQRR